MFAYRFTVFLALWFLMVFAPFRLPAQVTVGAYPTYPAVGPLEGTSPQEQARWLRARGITLAGGRFKDGEIPEALRAEGIKTFGLVVLWQGEQHWTSHPESRPITAVGQPLFKDRWYAGVCPNQDWLREAKLNEIEAMLTSGYYDVINLDFIRYPVHWEVPEPRIPDTCYGPVCLRKFQKDTGIRIPDSLAQVSEKARWIKANHVDAWYRWRADQITGFAAEVKRLRDEIRPATLISLAAVPWQASDYDNAIYRVVGQDFKALAAVIDVFNPMSYHALNHRRVEWIGEVNRDLRRVTGKPVWPFVIFDTEHELRREEWRETFGQALANGATGLIVFPFKNLWDSEGRDAFLERFAGR